MKTDIHFWSYLAQFFLEWEMFQTEVVEKIKTHILCLITFFRKWRRLWDNVEIYCTAVQVTDDNMAECVACGITKATDTHSEHVIFIAFPLQQWLHQLNWKEREGDIWHEYMYAGRKRAVPGLRRFHVKPDLPSYVYVIAYNNAGNCDTFVQTLL